MSAFFYKLTTPLKCPGLGYPAISHSHSHLLYKFNTELMFTKEVGIK